MNSENLSSLSVEITVNGRFYQTEIAPHKTLLDFLRDDLHLTGTKEGCGQGDCGTCIVLIDGRPVNACLMLAINADGRHVLTIEGIAEEGRLHPLQQSFIDKGAVQCGFCTPAMILSSKALLDEKLQEKDLTEEEIKQALTGVLCRCGSYKKIVEAVLTAAKTMRSKSKKWRIIS